MLSHHHLNSFNGAVGEPVFLNGYTYANANPVNLTDPSGLSPFCKPDEQTEQNGCEAAPFGNSGLVEPTYKPAGFIRLTYLCDDNASTRQTWGDERVADVRAALTDIDNRFSSLGISHRAWLIFKDLEFRIIPSDVATSNGHYKVNYGLTKGARLVIWNENAINLGLTNVPSPSGPLNPSVSEAFKWVVIHELGHVLQNRTEFLEDDSMYRTAERLRLRPIVYNANGSQIVLGRKVAQDAGVEEDVADHFLNWVYDTYKSGIAPYMYTGDTDSFDNDTTAAYWVGGTYNGNSSVGILGWLNHISQIY